MTRALDILSEKGIVTSASIVATGLDVEAAASLKNVSLGVHLDILRGRPLSHWQEVSSLVDANGAFLVSPVALFERYAAGKLDHLQVEKEWSAQIERVLDLGVKPTHLTSHKHVHGWPSLTRMAAGLARGYGIEWVRKPEECSEISKLNKDGLQAKFQNVCGFFDREVDEVNWTDVYWDGAEGRGEFSVDSFLEHLHENDDVREDSVVEICCCPGVTIVGDPSIPVECNPPVISSIWRKEFKSLAEDDWMGCIAGLGARLTPYGG